MTDQDLDALLDPHTPAVREVFGALRAVVREVMPDAVEQLDLPDRLLAYGFGPPGGVRLSGFAVALIPHTAHVNVQLADGALLPDPTGIVEGTGKRIRHAKCRSIDDAVRPALRPCSRTRVRDGEWPQPGRMGDSRLEHRGRFSTR